MPEGIEACLGRRMALLRPNRSVVDPRYLLYFYLSPFFQRLIAKNTIHGATVPRIGLASMPSWEVEIPSDLTEQQAIADVLGALDDKIAANQNEVNSSEQLAILSASRASRQIRLASIIKQSKTQLHPRAFDPLVAHFSLPAFDAAGTPAIEAANTIKSNKSVVTEPAVLVSKLNPRIPRLWDVPTIPDCMAIASTEFVILVPIGVSSTVLWAALRQPLVTSDLASKVAGTSGSHQRVKPSEVMDLRVGDPLTLDSETRDFITGLGRLVYARRAESIRLAATREELLPLLMSGRIRVRDAEKVVEEVV